MSYITILAVLLLIWWLLLQHLMAQQKANCPEKNHKQDYSIMGVHSKN